MKNADNNIPAPECDIFILLLLSRQQSTTYTNETYNTRTQEEAADPPAGIIGSGDGRSWK